MKTINKIKNFVNHKGKSLPKLFVWAYASIFIACGLLVVVGILWEFLTKGTVNFQALTAFVKEYFAPSVLGSFALVGVLLIDKNENGIPDEWEKGEKENDKL